MPIAAIRRRLCPWLAGLFLAAQTFGVVPLMSEHVTHVVESELVLHNDDISTNTPAGDHRHYRGDADGFVQHHELQDLSGVFTSTISQCEAAFARVAANPRELDALDGTAPALLERPPKLFLSV
jgi:hypothetical protein